MNPKPIESYTDLELSELLMAQYQQLIQAQGNLQAIQNEIQRRKTEKGKPETKSKDKAQVPPM
jgi:hypothetical protein